MTTEGINPFAPPTDLESDSDTIVAPVEKCWRDRNYLVAQHDAVLSVPKQFYRLDIIRRRFATIWIEIEWPITFVDLAARLLTICVYLLFSSWLIIHALKTAADIMLFSVLIIFILSNMILVYRWLHAPYVKIFTVQKDFVWIAGFLHTLHLSSGYWQQLPAWNNQILWFSATEYVKNIQIRAAVSRSATQPEIQDLNDRNDLFLNPKPLAAQPTSARQS